MDPLATLFSTLPRNFHTTPLSHRYHGRRPKGRDSVLSSLNVTVDGLNIAKEPPHHTAKVGFGSVAILFTTARVSFLLFCDEISKVYTARTQWSTNKTTLSSGDSVLISAESLNGE